LVAAADEECIGGDDERIRSLFDETPKGRIQLAIRTSPHKHRLTWRLRLAPLENKGRSRRGRSRR